LVGHDGRRYLIDLNRAMPPLKVNKQKTEIDVNYYVIENVFFFFWVVVASLYLECETDISIDCFVQSLCVTIQHHCAGRQLLLCFLTVKVSLSLFPLSLSLSLSLSPALARIATAFRALSAPIRNARRTTRICAPRRAFCTREYEFVCACVCCCCQLILNDDCVVVVVVVVLFGCCEGDSRVGA
jgi:hypothetical protein